MPTPSAPSDSLPASSRPLQVLARPQKPKDMGRRRRHGCQLPLHGAQIAVVAILLLSGGIFYGLSAPALPTPLRRTLQALYSAQLAVTTVIFLAISLFDPADPALLTKRGDRGDSPAIPVEATTNALGTHAATTYATAGPTTGTTLADVVDWTAGRCGECDVSLARGTRHCSVCRKCVAGFDHHCVYLNTCIGSRNYPLFVALLACTSLLLLTQLGVSGYTVACARPPAAQATAMLALSVPPLLELLCILVLAAFHLYLSLKRMTTYECMYEWFERQQQERQDALQHETHKADVDRLELGVESSRSTGRSRSGSVCGGATSSDTNSSSSGGGGGPVGGQAAEWMQLRRAQSVVLLTGIPSGELRRDFEQRRRASLSEPPSGRASQST